MKHNFKIFLKLRYAAGGMINVDTFQVFKHKFLYKIQKLYLSI